MLFWIWTIGVIAAIVLFFRRTYSKFQKCGVNHLPPTAPLGNIFKSVLRLEHMTENSQISYDSFPEDRFIGHFELINPVIVLRDLELIKKVAVKDFDHFVDHRASNVQEDDSLLGRGLFFLQGPEWRDMRSTLSPAFTSSKIKLMVPFMTEVGAQMSKVLKANIEKTGDGYLDLDSRDLTTRYANDVIATCAFGLKINSHEDDTNEFYVKGRAVTDFKLTMLIKFFGFLAFPKLMKLMNQSMMDNTMKGYFRGLVNSVMKNREENNIVRHDMIQLLMEAKKGNLYHDEKSSVKDDDAGFATVEESAVGRSKVSRAWSDNDLIAQAMLFFVAGFNTVATTMTFLLYELAVNPEVQDKLVAEIREVHKKTGGKINYDSIQQMQYLDMVISEILRLWTPVTSSDRVCCKDYNLGKPNNKAKKDYIVRKGEGVYIPVWAIHHSPEYFPNPNKFDPERFSEENKHKITPLTFMPFGVGPRNCVGSRFALCEVKVMIYQLLLDFEVSPCPKTCIPMELSNESFHLRIKGGHFLRFRVRS